MKKILVVGITPPPYGGQAMMTERLVRADFKKIKVYHVRMAFSKSMASVGNFEIWKLFHMVEVVIKALFFRFKYNISTLYYMPGGSNVTPVIRDVFILSFLRLAFKKTIFHFRAAGVSEIVEQQQKWLKKAANMVYYRPDLAIHLAPQNPDDGGYFRARKTVILPNGLEDSAQLYLPVRRVSREYTTILYVGVIQESKGITVLLEATQLLKGKGYDIRVNIVGDFASESYREQVVAYCNAHDLTEVVHFPGVKKGDDKWQYFLDADIFCFPSFFEAESFGNVVVEAMMFQLPVLASRWRGIQSIIEENETGYLVDPKDSPALADGLIQLIDNPEKRSIMGKAGRVRYENRYAIPNFLESMEDQFLAYG